MHRLSLVAAVAALGLCLSPVSAHAAGSVEIVNQSSWELHYLYVGPAGNPDWGPDQLGDHVIGLGESFTLNKIACGNYDIMVVDEDGDQCELYDIRLCSDKIWRITDTELLTCQAESE